MLRDILSSKRNNLDLLRLFAACAVIYSHAGPATGLPMTDVGVWLTHGYDTSGALAVKFFFFISGMVVTSSLLRSQSLLRWSLARVLRIFPAYTIALVLSVLILLPLFSDSHWGIFATKEPYRYVFKNLCALVGKSPIVFQIPGVFAGFHEPSLNASIWTLPFETKAYFWTGLLFIAGGFRFKYLATAILAAVLVAELAVPNSTTFGFFAAKSHLLPCFVAGALFAVWSDKIPLRPEILVVLLIGAIVTSAFAMYQVFYCAVLFYGSLILSAQSWFVRFKPSADISYGTYLYGWPSQMFVFGVAPWLPISAHITISMGLALTLGWASWTFIEKRAKFSMSNRAIGLPESAEAALQSTSR